jgi:hypothetical protein
MPFFLAAFCLSLGFEIDRALKHEPPQTRSGDFSLHYPKEPNRAGPYFTASNGPGPERPPPAMVNGIVLAVGTLLASEA